MQQVLHHSYAIVACRKVQRRGVTSLQISAVHILSRAQLLQRESACTQNNINMNATGLGNKFFPVLWSLLSNVPFTQKCQKYNAQCFKHTKSTINTNMGEISFLKTWVTLEHQHGGCNMSRLYSYYTHTLTSTYANTPSESNVVGTVTEHNFWHTRGQSLRYHLHILLLAEYVALYCSLAEEQTFQFHFGPQDDCRAFRVWIYLMVQVRKCTEPASKRLEVIILSILLLQ